MVKSFCCGVVFAALPTLVAAAEPVPLTESTYKSDLGVLIIQVNWGRTWKCGQFENAQLQALTFTKSPIDNPDPISLDLVTPSKLFVDNKFLPYAFVVQPGEYFLTGFDVKVARSVSDVAHIKGSKENLIKDGKPIGKAKSVYSRLSGVKKMKQTFTAVVKQDANWWIGWVEEVPGVNCQESTREGLLESLRISLAEAIEFNRMEARNAAGKSYEEFPIAV